MNRIHERAVFLAKNYLKVESELVSVIGEIETNKIHLSLGYPSVFAYCVGALKLSESQSYALITVSRKCKEVPALKTAIETNHVSLSKARRIVSVIKPDNQDEWLTKAQTLTAQQLEKEVVKIKPLSVTKPQLRAIDEKHSKLSLVLSAVTESLLKEARELLCQNQRKPVNYEETLQSLCLFYLETKSPVRKAQRVLAKNSKLTCTVAPKNDRDRELFPGRVDPTKASGVRKPIPTKTKHHVFQRDQSQCQALLPDGKPCQQSRWIELHHIKPLSNGGTHALENLTTLCSAHHEMQHLA